MNKTPGLLLLLGLLVLPAACDYANSNSESEQQPQDPVVLQLGEKVYKTHCRACHLPDGRSRVKRLNLADDEWLHCDGKVEQITQIVSDGIEATQMQSFKELLSEEEIQAVAAYVKDLSRKE